MVGKFFPAREFFSCENDGGCNAAGAQSHAGMPDEGRGLNDQSVMWWRGGSLL